MTASAPSLIRTTPVTGPKDNYTVLHSRTGFVDGALPHQRRHMLRRWLQLPQAWPLSPEVPSHMGYTPTRDTPILVETEA